MKKMGFLTSQRQKTITQKKWLQCGSWKAPLIYKVGKIPCMRSCSVSLATQHFRSLKECFQSRIVATTHIPQVRTQNFVFLKYEFFRITNQSTRYRALRHSGRDYWWNEFGWFVQPTAWNSSPINNQRRPSGQSNDSQCLRLYQCTTIFIWEVFWRNCNGTFLVRGNTTRTFERWTLG